jgi:methyl-accepting chemotaxis protein
MEQFNHWKKIELGMGEGADQMAAASSLVSSASQSLAEGSSEQVASIKTVCSGKKNNAEP